MQCNFLDYFMDTSHHQLSKDGQDISLDTQTFELLALLVKHSDRIVYKDEIFNTIWAGRTVSSSSLDTRLRTLRIALGDNGKDQKIIKTYRHRGYKFLPSVEFANTETDKDSDIQGNKKYGLTRVPFLSVLIGMAAFGLILLFAFNRMNETGRSNRLATAKKPLSFVVVPGILKRSTECIEPYDENIARSLIHELPTLDGSHVIVEGSAFALKDSSLVPNKIRESLNVEYLIDLQCTLKGPIQDIIVQLIELKESKIIWAETYQGSIDQFTQPAFSLKIKDDILANISEVFELNLSGIEDQPKLIATYVEMAKAREWMKRRNQSALLNAIDTLKSVIEVEPNFTPAYAELVRAYELAGRFGAVPHDTAKADMRVYLSRGNDVNPSSPEMLVAMGLMEKMDRNYERALTHFEAAIDLRPNYAQAYGEKASVLLALRRTDLAEIAHQKALMFDPLSVGLLVNFTELKLTSGDMSGALEVAEKNLKWNPKSFGALQMMGQLQLSNGNVVEAFKYIHKGLELNPDDFYSQLHMTDVLISLDKVDEIFEYVTDDNVYALALALNGRKEDLKKKYSLEAGNAFIAYAFFLVGEPDRFLVNTKKMVKQAGFDISGLDIGRTEALRHASYIYFFRDDSDIDSNAIDENLERYFQKYPVGPRSTREDYSGAVLWAVSKGDLDHAIDILQHAIDRDFTLMGIVNGPIYSELQRYEKFEFIKMQMESAAAAKYQEIKRYKDSL